MAKRSPLNGLHRESNFLAILLFNLKQDVSEPNDLAAVNPEKVEALTTRMKELDAEITANARPAWRKK
jgi:arylsulfatase A